MDVEYYKRGSVKGWLSKVANYCGECALWRGSKDENRYGERYCVYSRRYESADQNSYGCRGFVDGTRRYCDPLTIEEKLVLKEIYAPLY